MSRPVFGVDLSRCTGCEACRIACRDRADLPDGVDWLRVCAEEAGRFPSPRLTYRVVHCFHCSNPPCAASCPEEGITQDEAGMVRIDAGRCVACRRCAEACPFGAIASLPGGRPTKCDGCADQGRLGAEPTCVRACPMRALFYAAAGPVRPGRVLDAAFHEHGAGPAVAYWRRPPATGTAVGDATDGAPTWPR